MENFQTVPPAPVKPQRPTFLLVLCILTFIGSGIGIVSGISSYLTANTAGAITQAAMEDAQEKIQDAGGSDAGTRIAKKMLSNVGEMTKPENVKKTALFSIVSGVLTLLGGILMFGLKKPGFWIYVLGTIIGVAAPIIIYGSANFVSIFTSSMTAFVGVVFVILYGLNLKHLR